MDVRVTNILLRIEKEFGVSRQALRGDGRSAKIVIARFEAMLRIKEVLGFTSVAVGRVFNRDHATVLYGWKKAQERRDDICANFSDEDIDFRNKLVDEKCRLALKIRDIDRLLGLYEREPTKEFNIEEASNKIVRQGI